jgi:PAS domain S-box-containing protein
MAEDETQAALPSFVGTPQRPAPVQPTEVERRLAPKELFFSTTDRKGIITAGNSVFSRVACYPLEVMIGRAHNIVRHPDMPRAVFQLLWDELGAGRPVVAYVKNLAADGAYYWVLASIVPIHGGGYLSVRLHPSAPSFAAAKAIYAELVGLERKIEGDNVRNRKASIAASGARLGELLTQAGFADYGAFMRTALLTELAARAAELPDDHQQILATAPAESSQFVRDALGSYRSIATFFTELIGDFARYADTGATLGEHSSYLRRMGDDIQLFALNAQIGASRLGAQGAALDAVARLLTDQAHATSPLVATVAAGAAAVVEEIHEMTFQLALMTIQSEMVAVFAHELADDPAGEESAAANIACLTDALSRASDRTVMSLSAASQQLQDVLTHVDLVATGLSRLARLSLNGRVELATIPDAGAIGSLFTDVEHQVGEARERLTEFDTVKRTASEITAAANHPAMRVAGELHDRTLAFAGGGPR